MTERERRDAGLWYDANFDEELLRERRSADRFSRAYNAVETGDDAARSALLAGTFGAVGERVCILPPLAVDYGYNCFVGDDTFINHDAYLMDCAPINIGSHVFIGPRCGMYTGEHPLTASERNRGLERAAAITVEDDVWIGGDVVILPGVTIGRGSVVGAHSTVTHDIPSGVVCAGNPCRVLREITEADAPELD